MEVITQVSRACYTSKDIRLGYITLIVTTCYTTQARRIVK
uniref:Uncharacterized protein n=1 Tax=Anguilla anguilla TaxID=7936 RepID=A0A0E9RY64_ANGAN